MIRILALLLGLFCALPSAKADPVYQSEVYACVHEKAVTGAAQVVAASITAQQIYVCGFVFAGAGTTPTATLFYAATGTSCATPLGTVVPVLTLPVGGAIVDHPTYYAGLLPVPSGDDLCATTAGTGSEALVFFSQF